MGRINILDIETSNKIAAGEVVERPSSVVKELVENSIDAKSSNITIEIEEGGQSFIRIIDDGIGIHNEDIKKAFSPHATSKIKAVEDIFAIGTLGFRGEALPSIASVSNVTIKSKTKDCDIGREFSLVGGLEEYLRDCSMNSGTQIEVKDLFFNVPARKKFLKSTKREGAIINDLVSRIALANPDIAFKLFNNDKKIVNTYGNGKIIDAIRSIYGKNTAENLIYFEEHTDLLSVYGYIGNNSLARGSRNNQTLFVNKRYVKNKLVTVAVENAYRSFNTSGKFPFFVLFVDIYPELIDVNIHPTKSEIKFKDDRLVFKVVFDTIHQAIRESIKEDFNIDQEKERKEFKSEIINQVSFENYTPLDTNLMQSKIQEEENKLKDLENDDNVKKISKKIETNGLDLQKSLKEKVDIPITLRDTSITQINNYEENNKNLYNMKDSSYNLENIRVNENNFSGQPIFNERIDNIDKENLDKGKTFIHKDEVENKEELAKQQNINKKDSLKREAKFDSLKVIGQFNNTYILAERDQTLYLIDQHAAHEKILFEKYLKQIENFDITVQPLMVPLIIELSLNDFGHYEDNKDVFKKAGFVIEDFGNTSIRIEEVPYFLGKLNAKNLFLSILDNLKNLGSGKTTEVKYNKIATLACKAAVKANDILSMAEMTALIEQLRFIEDPFNCPHGRPTIIKFTSYELDKKFKRIL